MLENCSKKWVYKEQKSKINGKSNPYTASYKIDSDMLLTWWNTCEVKPNHLQQLAIKLFQLHQVLQHVNGCFHPWDGFMESIELD